MFGIKFLIFSPSVIMNLITELSNYFQNTWQQQPLQQQDVAVAQQDIYFQQDQQTYWNNNMSRKNPPMTVPPTNYQSTNPSWNQQPVYMQQHQSPMQQPSLPPQQMQQPQQQQQHQYSNSSNHYQYEDVSNKPIVFNSSQQNFNNSNPSGGDPWNWDWDDSSNNSPATSFSTNNNFQNDSSWNWNVDDAQGEAITPTTAVNTVYSPVQNYFQPVNSSVHTNQNFQDGKGVQIEQLMNDLNIQPKVQSESVESSVESRHQQSNIESVEAPPALKPEPVSESCTKVLNAECSAEVNLKSTDIEEPVFDVKSNGAQSFQNGNLEIREIKAERLTPELSGGDLPKFVSDIKTDDALLYQSVSLPDAPEFKQERLSPVAGREIVSPNNTDNNAVDVSTPPPGLDRMVLGQLTENENDAPNVPEVNAPLHLHNRHLHIHQGKYLCSQLRFIVLIYCLTKIAFPQALLHRGYTEWSSDS